jgi:glycosyltransferase involved in cell wall biosynthesis
MKISILITYYNKKKYIEESINSVLKQSDPNWELLICDDCSRREDSIFLEQLIQKLDDDRIHLIKNNTNIGTGNSLIRLISLVDTKIIGSLDADDTLSSDALKITKEIYENNPSISFTYSAQYICDEMLIPQYIKHSKQITENSNFAEKFYFTAFRSFKKNTYLKTTGYETTIPYCDDNDISLKLEEVDKGFYINKPLYFYRQLNDSMSNDLIKKQRAIISLIQILLRTKHRRDQSGIKIIDWDTIYSRIKGLRLYGLQNNTLVPNNKLEKILSFLSYKLFKKVYLNKKSSNKILDFKTFPNELLKIMNKTKHLRSFVYSAKHEFAFLNIEGNAYEDLVRIVIDNNWDLPYSASNFDDETIQNFIGFRHDNEFKLTINHESFSTQKTIRFAVIRDPLERFFAFLESLPNHDKYTEPMILEQILLIEESLKNQNREWLKLNLIPQTDLLKDVKLDYLINYNELPKFLKEKFDITIKTHCSLTIPKLNSKIIERLEKIYAKDIELLKNILK